MPLKQKTAKMVKPDLNDRIKLCHKLHDTGISPQRSIDTEKSPTDFIERLDSTAMENQEGPDTEAKDNINFYKSPISESLKTQAMDAVDNIPNCSDEEIDSCISLRDFRDLMKHNAGVPISGLSSSYLVKNLDLLTVAKFGNGK